MKNKLFVLLALAWLSTLFPGLSTLHAQGTAFTYQGRLVNDGAAATGLYDLQFSLFDAAVGGSLVGSSITTNAVAVSNGLFTVTLDFGAGIFTGADRWLFLSVKSNGVVSFTPLTPPQHVTAAPYAVTAGNLTGALPSASLSGAYANAVSLNNGANSFSGSGAGLTNLNADLLGGLGAANFWMLGGNASTGGWSLGNVDNQPLTLISWGSRVLRLETRSVSLGLFDSLIAVNTLGGAASNVISNGVLGGTIAGGGAETNHLFGSEPAPNTVFDNFSTVGGGLNNTAGSAGSNFDDARAATVAGGEENMANNAWATVGGGQRNTSSGQSATVAGGFLNSASGSTATVGGGFGNTSSAASATVGGGQGNGASNFWATVGGGHGNTSSGTRATVGGGDGNRSTSDTATVAGGRGNTSSGTSATVGGGWANTSSGEVATVAGGRGNTSSGPTATVGGGWENTSSIDTATIGGGDHNTASGLSATVPGGDHNLAAGNYSFAAGQQAKANHQGSFVWADAGFADFVSTANNQFAIRASGGILLSDNTPNISFGSTTRQMLNLYSSSFGIGIQSSTLYFRCQNTIPTDGFCWYKGGVHNDNYGQAGAGGVELMRLDSSGLTVRGTFVSSSDRNVKQDFADVNSRTVLEKVLQLPIQTWAYKSDPGTKHLGPVAQDFYAAFNVGPDDKHIATVDESGVALAAIQGLNQKVEDLNGQLKRRDAQNALLMERLEKLERILGHKLDGGSK